MACREPFPLNSRQHNHLSLCICSLHNSPSCLIEGSVSPALDSLIHLHKYCFHCWTNWAIQRRFQGEQVYYKTHWRACNDGGDAFKNAVFFLGIHFRKFKRWNMSDYSAFYRIHFSWKKQLLFLRTSSTRALMLCQTPAPCFQKHWNYFVYNI